MNMEDLKKRLQELEVGIKEIYGELATMKDSKLTVRSFKEYEVWNDYVTRFMKQAKVRKNGKKITVTASQRVLAQWNGDDGFINEQRNKARLWATLTQGNIW